jgi:hypothetical protein
MLKSRDRHTNGSGKIITGMILACITLNLVGIVNDKPQAEEPNMTLTLRSDAFTDGGEIPARYTCEGMDIAPSLTWTGVPGDARSLVLIVDDPDAPDPKAPKMTWVHWVLYNIPPLTSGLAEGTTSGDLPATTGEGLNGWQHTGYGGPCPPIGRHRYYFKLYALDKVLQFKGNPAKTEVEAAMNDHVLTRAQLVGTYKKR